MKLKIRNKTQKVTPYYVYTSSKSILSLIISDLIKYVIVYV